MPIQFGEPGLTVERDVAIPMRDGVNLQADIYRPQVSDPLPVLLMRLPYGRAIASTVTYAHPAWYARQGYTVVIQSVRGTDRSGGDFYPFAAEYDDGYDSVKWCAQDLPGSNGRVGMYGFSYQGVTQFQAAVEQPPGLITICPAMATADFYHGWYYFGGALALDFALPWGLQLAQNKAWFQGIEPQATDWQKAQAQIGSWLDSTPLNQFPLLKSSELGSSELGQHYFDWVNNPQADAAYWQQLNPLSRFEHYNLPALHIAGWADLFIEATLNTYTQAQQATTQPQKLIVGPWRHLPWLRRVGEVDYGSAAVAQIDRTQVRWFDYWLKGEANGILEESPVQSFLMGENRWLDLSQWPPEITSTRIYLHSNGMAHGPDGDGVLSTEPPTDQPPDFYIYDPRIPNPSTAYGPYDQRSVHQRTDLVSYCSARLDYTLPIAGTPVFELYAATSVPDTDWVVKLMDVDENGSSLLITCGVLRARYRHSWSVPEWVPADQVQRYRIKLRPTCHSFAPGHHMQITIASAAFPLIDRNANTKVWPHEARVKDFQMATQQIHHSPEFPSCLHLPMLVS
ncbi:CocE/NonD family hydrolase [Leptolyngbya sp. FACHB-261]|uniref:CocE/NonD family hydrolase n=1 Tax=Leptolyngbya sp. FACHB-261 TaxID=2692806 RepID=UPI0016886BEB|nr:CocE/NonD family hydrolase [Leptolyngbya sp. FACHB-261]MBD2100778.1 CocE/NonD family hydrolase [Leptolyngbya sp. FACHB-261]